MTNDLPSTERLNRLAKAIMQRHRVGYREALELLASFRLYIAANPDTISLTQYQAALLTAVNTGKRAFLGGVTVDLRAQVSCVLPGWQGKPLGEVVASLGGTVSTQPPPDARRLGIGVATETELNVVADGWRVGLLVPQAFSPLDPVDAMPLAGILGAGLGVGRLFMDCAGISLLDPDPTFGLSLWAPEMPWLSAAATGPELARLPAKLWLLGLGHLGQAYLWILGLLPFPQDGSATFFLQDYDHITEGNRCAGLLCEESNLGEHKTRACARWIEKRGVKTVLIERAFDEMTRSELDEPRVALCGFDSASGRRLLENAKFDLVVECSLGASLDHFDRLMLHTFPEATKRPDRIWSQEEPVATDFDPALFGPKPNDEKCGVLVEQLAKKPISASFVGAAAAAFVVAELLRGLHGGQRYELIHFHLRSDLSLRAAAKAELYPRRHARNGVLPRAA